MDANSLPIGIVFPLTLTGFFGVYSLDGFSTVIVNDDSATSEQVASMLAQKYAGKFLPATSERGIDYLRDEHNRQSQTLLL